MNSRGKLITLEGPEGAGKSTQAAKLAAYLRSRGYPVVMTREPGGTDLAEKLRDIVKHYASAEPVYPLTELLLFEAARVQHVLYKIAPELAQGAIVICDRFTDSTEAYQGAGRSLNVDTVLKLNDLATDGVRPDLTLLLDLPPEVGLARATRRSAKKSTAPATDRLEAEKLDFHRKVREQFLAIARREPERVKVLDATLSADALFQQLLQMVHDGLPEL